MNLWDLFDPQSDPSHRYGEIILTIILSTLAVTFAAFCVWLMVRIVNRRERWAKWTLALAIGPPVLYVGSFGPACWISQRSVSNSTVRIGSGTVSTIFQPMLYLWMNTQFPSKIISWYALVGTEDPSHAINTVDGSYVLKWMDDWTSDL